MNSIDFVKGHRVKEVPWAITPETLAELDYRLYTLKPKVVLECGSGLSTYVLARYAQKTPGVTVISLEHNEKYFNKTSELLGSLKNGIMLLHYPLSGTPPVYDVDLSVYPKIDFVLLDGPPANTGGRKRIYEWLQPYLNDKHEVWLDDGNRREELEAAIEWGEAYSLSLFQTKLKKGVIILRNYNKLESDLQLSDVVVTMLSGNRPELLSKTLYNLPKGLLKGMIGLANGGDKMTIEIYKKYGIEPIVTPYLLRTGSATSFLADIAYESGKKYWLQLQDDWSFVTEDEQWLRRAKYALKNSHQVRLRHISDNVKSVHAVTKKKFNLKTSRFGNVGEMHWTFNPTLQKCHIIPEVFPCVSETDAQRVAYSTGNKIVTQLYPGCFKHIGVSNSLIDATTGRRKKTIDDRLIERI